MKVLHVIPSVGPLRGGPSVVLRTMARGLARAGVAVDVATTDDNGDGRLDVLHAKPVVEDGVTYRYFPRQTKFYTFSWPLTRWLAEHVKDYDIVHIHALFSYAAMPAAFYSKRYKVPYIVRPLGVLNRWGMQNRRPFLKKISYALIEKHILNGAAAIHYTSEQERVEALALRLGQMSVVIPNAAEISLQPNNARGRFRTSHGQLADRFLILFLSRVDRIKALDILLPAFAQLRTRYPQATLVIAGDGELDFTAQLKQEAEQLGIASNVFWVGFLSTEEKWAALADADVFVLPSYSENFGVAVVEAMAAGLPVVVSDQVPIHQDISQAHAGLVSPCRPEELTEALAKLIADDKLRAMMGYNGERLARTRFSSDAVTESLIQLYRDIVDPVPKTLEQMAF